MIGVPVLTRLCHLKDRSLHKEAKSFSGTLLSKNLTKELVILYTKTGGLFIAQPGCSIIPEMHDKEAYQLYYRWPNLAPIYPMTRLVDELVQIEDGVWLGRLVMATRHYNLGTCRASFLGERTAEISLGESYQPSKLPSLEHIKNRIGIIYFSVGWKVVSAEKS